MNPIQVLFVCVHNSARSQMAEAYLNILGEGKFHAESAGIEPGTLNPFVVKAMAEDGIDISGKATKSVFDFYKQGSIYNYVVTVCDPEAGERCPIFPGRVTRLHWGFADPSSFQGNDAEKLAFTRKVRDEIRTRIEEFVKETAI
jgi:arsenate reductase